MKTTLNLHIIRWRSSDNAMASEDLMSKEAGLSDIGLRGDCDDCFSLWGVLRCPDRGKENVGFCVWG